MHNFELESEDYDNYTGAYNKNDGIRAVAGITSTLSALGSMLIILLYVCYPELRTTARYILVHLSIADFGTALSNLIGEVVLFDNYYSMSTHNFTNRAIERFCVVQAFSAVYFTLSSCLWTLHLAFFMYILIMGKKTTFKNVYLVFSYLFCYGMPLLVCVWLVCTERLGYAPYDSAGWCTLRSRPMRNYHGKRQDKFGTLFGYDLWILLTCICILTIYTSVHGYIKLEVSENIHDCHNCILTASESWALCHKDLALRNRHSFNANSLHVCTL